MAHPFNSIRGDKVANRRVATLTKGYASGGSTTLKKALSAHRAEHKALGMDMDDDAPMARRASGGRVGKKGNVVVNVITQAPQKEPEPPMPPPMPPVGAMPPPPPGPPPGGPPPGAMGPGGPPMGGPPMMGRKSGGRVNTGTKVFEASERAGTKVQHDPGKNDTNDMKRPGMKMHPKVVTFATGGGVVSFKTGGRIYSPAKGGMGPKLPGGVASGETRIAQAKRAKRNYHGPD